MEMMQIAVGYGDNVNEMAFFLSMIVIGLFYPAYKKCIREIQKEEMLDQFLKD